jgi:hypothetical protein
MSKGIDRTVDQLFNFKFEVFRSNLRLHWFSIGLRFRDVCLAPLLCHTCRSGPHSTLSRPATSDPAAI